MTKAMLLSEEPADRWPTTALREASGTLGISCAGAKLFRIGQCATIALPVAGLVARVARPGYPLDALDAELRFARIAHRAGLPVLAPADEVTNTPVLTREGPVTFWPLLWPDATSELDWGWLGRTLRLLHQLPVPHGLPSLWDLLKRVEDRIAVYAAQPHACYNYVAVLSAACAAARNDLLHMRSELGVGLVHGDACPSNVILTEKGPVLIDFDLAGVGPLEWDLMAAVVLHRRFGLPSEQLRSFLGAYGFNPAASQGFEVLLRVRELLDTSFALARSGIDLHAERELDIRMRAWLNPEDRSMWMPARATPLA